MIRLTVSFPMVTYLCSFLSFNHLSSDTFLANFLSTAQSATTARMFPRPLQTPRQGGGCRQGGRGSHAVVPALSGRSRPRPARTQPRRQAPHSAVRTVQEGTVPAVTDLPRLFVGVAA